MGLFNFGNKEKKTKEAINATKKQIITVIQTALLSCKDGESATVLRNIQTQLQSQGETSDERVLAIDTEILQLVSESNTYILKQQYPTAIAKLNKALNKAIERSQYCMAGGQMTKQDKAAADQAAKLMNKIASKTTKTYAEELQEKLDQKTAERDSLIREHQSLLQQNARTPGNPAIVNRLRTIDKQLALIRGQIISHENDLNYELSNQTAAELLKTTQESSKKRTITESQAEINRAALQAEMAAQKALAEETAKTDDVMAQFNSGYNAAYTQTTDYYGVSEAYNQGNQYGGTYDQGAYYGGTGTYNAAGAYGNTYGAPAQNQQGTFYEGTNGGFNAAGIGTADMARDIIKAKKGLEEGIEKFEDMIEDANDELLDYKSELVSLLKRRETASAQECLALDGKIDNLYSKMSSIGNKIKRYRQISAQLSDKLSLVEKLDAQQDLVATNSSIEQLTGGRFADLTALANYLNQAIVESNEKSDEIAAAIALSEADEANVDSASGSSGRMVDAEEKDEHKYDQMMRSLGMPLSQK